MELTCRPIPIMGVVFFFSVVFNTTSVIGEPVPKSRPATRFPNILYITFTASYKIDQIFRSTINDLFFLHNRC